MGLLNRVKRGVVAFLSSEDERNDENTLPGELIREVRAISSRLDEAEGRRKIRHQVSSNNEGESHEDKLDKAKRAVENIKNSGNLYSDMTPDWVQRMYEADIIQRYNVDEGEINLRWPTGEELTIKSKNSFRHVEFDFDDSDAMKKNLFASDIPTKKVETVEAND